MRVKTKEKIFNELSQDTFFQYKCTACNRTGYRTIVFYRSYLYEIQYFRICKDCFLNLTSKDVLDIYSQVGQENSYLTSTCSYCYKSCTKYLFVDKGLGKKLCIDCLTEMTANDSDQDEDLNKHCVVIMNEQKVSDTAIEKTLEYIHEQFIVSPYKAGLYRERMDEYGYYLVCIGLEDACKETMHILEGKDIKASIITKEEFDELSQFYFVIITGKQNKTDEEIEEIINGLQSKFGMELTEKGEFRQEIDEFGYFVFYAFSNCEEAEECWSILKSLDVKSKILNKEEWEDIQEDNNGFHE